MSVVREWKLNPKTAFTRMFYNSWLFDVLVVRNPATSLEKLNRVVCSYRNIGKYRVHRKIVDRGLSLAEFKVVFAGADAWVLDDVGAYANTSVECVEFLLTDEDFAGAPLFWTAANPVLSAERLRELASVTGERLACGMVDNPNVPFDVLLRFAGSSDESLASLVQARLADFDDAQFESELRGSGLSEFVGLPRAWVIQAVSGKNLVNV